MVTAQSRALEAPDQVSWPPITHCPLSGLAWTSAPPAASQGLGRVPVLPGCARGSGPGFGFSLPAGGRGGPRGLEEGLALSRCAVPTHAEALEDGRPRVPRQGAPCRHSAVMLFPDVDECAAEPPPCEDTQYCENINGSFVCEGERRPLPRPAPACPVLPSPPPPRSVLPSCQLPRPL